MRITVNGGKTWFQAADGTAMYIPVTSTNWTQPSNAYADEVYVPTGRVLVAAKDADGVWAVAK